MTKLLNFDTRTSFHGHQPGLKLQSWLQKEHARREKEWAMHKTWRDVSLDAADGARVALRARAGADWLPTGRLLVKLMANGLQVRPQVRKGVGTSLVMQRNPLWSRKCVKALGPERPGHTRCYDARWCREDLRTHTRMQSSPCRTFVYCRWALVQVPLFSMGVGHSAHRDRSHIRSRGPVTLSDCTFRPGV
jgi:hypothetical protein